MKKIKKILTFTMVSIWIMGMLSACDVFDKSGLQWGKSFGLENKTEGENIFENNISCKLDVVTMMGGSDPNADKFNQVINEFKKTHPNVIIENNSTVVDNDWKIRIEANFAMDNEPDIIQYFTDAAAINILQTGKFVTLEQMQAENPEIAKNTSAIALEQTKSPLDGVNYAVPTTGYWEGLFCNRDLFEQCNLELPKDWDDLLNAITVFNENGIIPIAAALNTVPHYWIESLLLTASTTEEFTSVPETTPADWIEGISKIKELYDAGAFSTEAATMDNDMASNLFKEKKAAMQLDGSWYLNGIPDQENTVVVPFPKWKDAKASEGVAIQGYSSGFYITKKAWEDPKKKQAALDFVLANTCDKQVLKYWGGNGVCSVPIPAGGEFTPLQVSGAAYAATITNPVTPTDSRVTPEAYAALIESIFDIAIGKKTAEEGIHAMLERNN